MPRRCCSPEVQAGPSLSIPGTIFWGSQDGIWESGRAHSSSLTPLRLLEQPEKGGLLLFSFCPFHTPLPEFLPEAGLGSGGGPGQPRRF